MAPPAPTRTASPPSDHAPLAQAASLTLGLCLIAYAATSILDRPELRLPLFGGALLLGMLAGTAGLWHHRRTRPARDLAEALAPVLRADSSKGLVRVRRRKRNIPTRLTITYPATFDDRDDKKRVEVRQIIATRLGGDVVATWRRPRRQILCRVALSPEATDLIESDTATTTPGADDTAEQARLRTRATSVVQAIMGTSAVVEAVSFDDSDSDTLRQIEVKYGTTTKDLSHHFRYRAILQLDSKLPGKWRDVWDLENDRVRFELRPDFPTNVPYPMLHKPRAAEIAFAVTEYSRIESWKLGSKNPHALVVGPTGSGKTIAIRNLVVGARVFGIPVVLCDPKMTEYLDFEDLEGVTVLTEPEEIAHAITLTHTEMMRRYRAIRRRQAKKGSFNRILFVLDEFFIFREQMTEIWQEMKQMDKELKGREHPCMSDWKRMVALARTASIHLVVGIQRPDAEFLTGFARDSFRKRISLDRPTPETARMMWGDSRAGNDLPNIQGRCISNTESGVDQLQVLRLMTPEDGEDFTQEDKATWEQLVTRMTAAAEEYANANGGDDGLGFLGSMGYRSRPLSGSGGGTALALDSSPVGVEEQPASAEQAADEDSDPEPISVFQLEIGDRVQFEQDEDPVEVVDLHFDEDEDGGELVEVDYTGPQGDDSRGFDIDAEVYRVGKS